MRRVPLVTVAAVLLLAGCSSSASKPATAPATAQPAVTTSEPTVAPTSCALTSKADVIERIITPGSPATAQRLGSVDLVNCRSVFDALKDETSTDPGYCTTAAWAADNPGYNVDAVPAPPLKNVQAVAGKGC